MQGRFTVKAKNVLSGVVACYSSGVVVICAEQPQLKHISVGDEAGFLSKHEIGKDGGRLAIDADGDANVQVCFFLSFFL